MRHSSSKPAPYRYTAVAAHQTRDQIEKLLLKYGAEGVAWQSLRSPERLQMLLQFKRSERVYRFEIELGTDDQEERQRMRALFYGLKAMFEQQDFGILRFEDVFLAYQAVALPNGTAATVREIIQGQLERHAVPSLETGLRALPARNEQ